jgi:arginine/lysine/ornithine decarboxylase
MSIYEAETSKSYPVKMEQSVGKISSEFLYLYPPGIPLLVPGEIISQELICQVREFQQMNMNINGLEDKKNRVINVIV